MPAPRVIDTTPRAPEPTGVEEFFSKVAKSYKEKQDQDTIGKIMEDAAKYEDEGVIFEKTIQAAQKSNLSPTNRAQFIKETQDTRRVRNEQEKAINARAKAALEEKAKVDKIKADAEADQNEAAAIFEAAGYSPEESKEKSKGLSAVSARAEVKRHTPGTEFAKIREKSISDYVNNSIEIGEAAEGQKFAISEARKAVRGDITGPGWTALLKHNPYSQLIIGLTPDEAALQGANKKLLEGNKGIFGAKPTEREIFLLLNEMLPSIGKTKEANEAGLDFIEKVNDMALAHSQIVDKLTNGGTKYVSNLEQLVNKEMKPIAEALRDELKEAVKKYGLEAQSAPGRKPGEKEEEIHVVAPDGKSYFYMTQSQIDNAKATQNVIFKPVK